MAFETLLDELETLKKALDEDDQNIQAAAKQSDEPDEDEEPDSDESGEDLDGDGDGKPMGKSFHFELESGETVEAFDATDLVKSLQTDLDASKAKVAAQETVITTISELLKSQSQAISDLRATVAKLAKQGQGRRSVLTVADAPDLAKSQPAAAASSDEILAKCLKAQAEGRITATDVARAESAINLGVAVPASITARLG